MGTVTATVTLQEGLAALASMDTDHARAVNGQGFNRIDGDFGHKLALIPDERMSPKQKRAAWSMLRKYRNQLAAHFGIAFELIPEPPVVTPEIQAEHELDRDRRRGVTTAPTGLNPRRMESLNPATAFIAILFPYDPILLAEMKMAFASGLRWMSEPNGRKYWRYTIPNTPDECKALLRFADDRGFVIERALRERIEDLAKAGERRREASRAASSAWEGPELLRKLYPFQRAGVEYLVRHAEGRGMCGDEMGLGKGSPENTYVLTPQGWRHIGKLTVGDAVIGSDGSPTSVIGVFRRGVLPVYKVTFSDGATIRCDGDHLWAVNTARGAHRGKPFRVCETRVLAGDDLATKSYRIPMVAPVRYPHTGSALPIDPYVLGYILANGGLTGGRVGITIPDPETAETLAARLPETCRLRHGVGIAYVIIWSRHHNTANPIKNALIGLGLMGKYSAEKYIPECYLRASIGDRRALLAGILDGDGCPRTGGIEYSTASPQLALDVQDIVESLGGSCRINRGTAGYRGEDGEYRQCLDRYRSSLRLPASEQPFWLSSKAKRYTPPKKYPPTRVIRSIEPDGEAAVVCIAVDAPDRLYVTERHIVTHNSIQSIAAMHSLNAYPVLMVTKASVKYAMRNEWLDTIPGFLDRDVYVVGSKINREAFETASVVIVNWDLLVSHLDTLIAHTWGGLIVDESHRAKSHGAQRTEAVKAIATGRRQKRNEVGQLVKQQGRKVYEKVREPIAYRILLTGTPTPNGRASEWIAQLEIMGRLEDMGGFYGFRSRYCNLQDDGYGHAVEGKAADSVYHEMNEKLRATCYVARKKQDVAPELPAITRSILPIDLAAGLRREYTKAEADIIRYVGERAAASEAFHASIAHLPTEAQEAATKAYKEDAENRAARAQAIVKLNALKQLTGRAKVEAAREWIGDFLTETGEPLIVFAHHIEVQKAILADYPDAVHILGSDTAEARNEAKESFQAGRAKLIVCATEAASEGVTLTAASNVLFVELEWTPSSLQQAEARCYGRLNDMHGATAWYLLVNETIDQAMWGLLAAKRAAIEAMADGPEKDRTRGESVAGGVLDALLRKGK